MVSVSEMPRAREEPMSSTFWTPVMLAFSHKASTSFLKCSSALGRSQPVRNVARDAAKSNRRSVFGSNASIASLNLSHQRSGLYKLPSFNNISNLTAKNIRFHSSSAASSNPNAELYVHS